MLGLNLCEPGASVALDLLANRRHHSVLVSVRYECIIPKQLFEAMELRSSAVHHIGGQRLCIITAHHLGSGGAEGRVHSVHFRSLDRGALQYNVK